MLELPSYGDTSPRPLESDNDGSFSHHQGIPSSLTVVPCSYGEKKHIALKCMYSRMLLAVMLK